MYIYAYLQIIKLLVLLLVLDAQVFKQLSRLTKVQVESLSTNAQKFTTTDFSEKLLNSFKGPNCLTNFRLIGRKVQHAYARPVPFNCNDFSLYLLLYILICSRTCFKLVVYSQICSEQLMWSQRRKRRKK